MIMNILNRFDLVSFTLLCLLFTTLQSVVRISFECDETVPDYYVCEGDVGQLATPCHNAVDGDWNTKVVWNTSRLGDFIVIITEDYSLPTSPANLVWEFKAHHVRTSSLMPTPMSIQYWNGASWQELHKLDDEEHLNEVFNETVSVPGEAVVGGRLTIKTAIMYSSHVAGGLDPSPPELLLHYVEYFEGKLCVSNDSTGRFPLNEFLFLAFVTAAAVITGSVIFTVTRKIKQTLASPQKAAGLRIDKSLMSKNELSINPCFKIRKHRAELILATAPRKRFAYSFLLITKESSPSA